MLGTKENKKNILLLLLLPNLKFKRKKNQGTLSAC
jgi:hypothetical protein